MPLSLEGMSVLDLSRVLAGPFCAAWLGDMGAEVIKIEDTAGGDEARTWPPQKDGESAAYLVCNRNKRGMTLDLKAAEGREILKRLVRDADVLVENFRTGTMEEFGLGYDALSALNPRLVYCAISAFGRTGPLADRAGYEALLQAYAGVMSLTGEPDGEPVRCGLSFLDLTTGIIAAFAVVNALLLRERTGRGQKVECSLLETAVSLLNYHAEAYLLDGTVAKRLGSSHPSVAPYRNFRCRDGRYVFIAAANDRLWSRLCAGLGLEHLTGDPRFKTNMDRVTHRADLEPIIAEAVAGYDLEPLLEHLDRAGVPAAPVNTIDRLMTDRQVEHHRMAQPAVHSRLGAIAVIGPPMKFSAMEPGVRRAAPAYGEHTDAILREHGWSEGEIAALRARGVIDGKERPG
ncbi:MAG: CoA transferase [Candidatus Rokubacteria bacterium]|nr:CoA transferase [Candidatus Rokubacteria bacterium]